VGVCTSIGIKAENIKIEPSGNFGLPGIIDIPTARKLPDGQIVITHQLHRSLFRSGLSFQVLPKVGVSFRYTGHGRNGTEANGRINHDRSFDAHIAINKETRFLPAISFGLRDFIGTGWYSSEYIVGSKTYGPVELTAGLGFGRLADTTADKTHLKVYFPDLKKEVEGNRALEELLDQ